ncbi:MAG TPA: hypothetical protein VFM89_07400, partial [Casimicrobiaceae bacterium]|nr:hypothetical protein [Casimicrobiaceae bacterium]
IFGGLIVSQLLTLFTTPVIYLAFDRLGGGSTRRKIQEDDGPSPAAARQPLPATRGDGWGEG